MKLFYRFALVLTMTGWQLSAMAAVTGGASIQVDWSSAVIGGVPVSASSYQDPSDSYVTVSSYTYGDTAPFTESLDYFYSYNGLPYEVASTPGAVMASAGFGSGVEYASVGVNSAGDGASTAMAWNGTGYIYQANASGQLSFEFDYSLSGSADIGGVGESMGAIYEVYLYMWDVDLFSTTFETLYATNGGDYNAAYRQANSAAFITDDYFIGTILSCSNVGSCAADQSGTFTTNPLLFGVQAGTNYGLEVFIQLTGNAYSSPVPVPGSAWMLGTALLGLVLISRRRVS